MGTELTALVPFLADGWVGPTIASVIALIVVGLIVWFIRTFAFSETNIQRVVHQLEEGGWVRTIQIVVLVAAVAFVVYLWFFREGGGFKGLAHEKAMEQAQIAREVSRGHGFSTLLIRPAALWQFEENLGGFPLERTPDTYHAPLNPLINAAVFKLMDAANTGLKAVAAKNEFFSRYTYDETMTSKLIVYSYDRILAMVQVFFFLLAVIVNYFTIRRLFDDRLAGFCVGLILVCERFWDYSMSALPQMLMLFLFSVAMYLIVRSIEARIAGRNALPWLAGTAAVFGLLALTHAITIWLFAGLLLFVIIYFRPRGRDAAIMALIFLLFYAPWLVRNYRACGTPVGLGWYSGLYQVKGTESQIMRSMEVSLSGVSPTVFRSKIQGQILTQWSAIYDYFGNSLLAPLFFVALLHLFKRPETSVLRWCILTMWLFGLLGMAVFGLPENIGPKANDLHLLFIPMMTAYGMAFILVMWTRLEINVRLVRIAFIALLYLVSGASFINQFVQMAQGNGSRVQWPPYVPPYIAILGQYTRENEIITSDMPWAVAWYADRKSLWLPMSVRDFNTLNDYNQLKGRIVGLHLTPVSGDQKFLADIIKGEYREWAGFILRSVNLKDFPLKAVLPLPIDAECIYYSDRDRWTNRED